MKGNPDFDLDNYINHRRMRKDTKFLEFMYCFTRALVGKHEWNQHCEIDNFSKIVTVSDEVYLYCAFGVGSDCPHSPGPYLDTQVDFQNFKNIGP